MNALLYMFFYIDSVFKLALGHFVEKQQKKTLISVRPCDLNEGENISASCYFNQQPAVVHLSISLIFSLTCSLNLPPPPQLSADCCTVFFPSADVIIKHVCQMEMSR